MNTRNVHREFEFYYAPISLLVSFETHEGKHEKCEVQSNLASPDFMYLSTDQFPSCQFWIKFI
jgi:hypothetical protein